MSERINRHKRSESEIVIWGPEDDLLLDGIPEGVCPFCWLINGTETPMSDIGGTKFPKGPVQIHVIPNPPPSIPAATEARDIAAGDKKRAKIKVETDTIKVETDVKAVETRIKVEADKIKVENDKIKVETDVKAVETKIKVETDI